MDNEALDRMTMALAGASLTDEAQMGLLDTQPVIQILPDANVIKIGGQSFIDRGRAAVFPLIEEIVENLPRHKMIIGTGAGTRARHAYSVGLDLGVPTGVLSVLGFFVSIQNAKMIHYLLAKHGIPSVEPAQFAQLPLYLAERQAVVSVGMPPYAYWQPNPEIGRIPPHAERQESPLGPGHQWPEERQFDPRAQWRARGDNHHRLSEADHVIVRTPAP